MVNRAEKRRQDREKAKAGKTMAGLSRKQIEEAEEEMGRGIEEAVPDSDQPTTAFAMLLDDWHALDHTKEGLKVQYQRTVELKQLGRNVDPNALVKGFAEVKQELEMIESQMVDVLAGLETARAEQLLAERHLVPSKGYIWRVPAALKERLQAALAPPAAEGELAPSDDHEVEVPTG